MNYAFIAWLYKSCKDSINSDQMLETYMVLYSVLIYLFRNL
jgi:hypothetical protein